LPKRFGKYGLTIHPEKTRLVAFQRPAYRRERRERSSASRPGTFDFLGFTHYWGRSRNGHNVVKQKTAASRLRRAIGTIADWCRRQCHRPISEQHRELSRKLQGHYAYYGITGNAAALSGFRGEVTELWRKWLSRRSWAGRLTWTRYRGILERYPLPAPVVVHSVFR
jgi:RNA-directed DNA polymerase